jgi:hypothetical protein
LAAGSIGFVRDETGRSAANYAGTQIFRAKSADQKSGSALYGISPPPPRGVSGGAAGVVVVPVDPPGVVTGRAGSSGVVCAGGTVVVGVGAGAGVVVVGAVAVGLGAGGGGAVAVGMELAGGDRLPGALL